MAREGSMRDRAARAAAGHGSAREEHEEVEVQEEERTPKARVSDRAPGRKRLTGRQKDILERDRAVLVDDGEDHVMGDPDDDTGTTEPDRRRAAKQPRQRRAGEEPFFQYRGRRFASQEELEDYLDDLEVERRVARQAPAPASRQTQPAGEQQQIPWDKLIEDTPGVMKSFADSLIQQIRNELIPAYQADRDMRDFWQTFYQDNPDLAKPKLKMLVEAIFMSHQDKLGPLPLDRARARLGRIVKAELREMGVPLEGAGGYTDDDEGQRDVRERRSRTMVEGAEGSGRGTRRERRQEEEGEEPSRLQNGSPVTLTSVLKARAARRRGEDTSSFFK